MRRTEQCSACGSDAAVVRGNYRFTESGLRNVVLQGIDIVQCKACGNQDPIIPKVNELMRVLAAAVVRKPVALTGEDVRFLRKYLKMTAEQFAQLLHADRTTLSKWETNTHSIGVKTDRLIRAVVSALGEGLKQGVEETVRNFTEIKKKPQNIRITMDPETMSYQYA